MLYGKHKLTVCSITTTFYSRIVLLKCDFFLNQIFIGLYGLLFRRNKEAAFSNYRLWESAGFVIAYAYSTTLCARMKLYVLFGNLVLGVIGYIIVEVRHRRKVNISHIKFIFTSTLILKILLFPFFFK